MAVHIDLIDQASGRVTLDGWELIRTAKVTGVTGDGHTRLYNAVTASGMPSLGDAHPDISYCYLREMAPTAIDSDIIEVRLIYRSPSFRPLRADLDTIQVGGRLSQVQTNTLYDGVTPISLSYTYPADYDYAGENWEGKGEEHTQGAMVTKFLPEHDVVISKTEFANPSPRAKAYLGKVNSGGWKYDMAAVARTWMCSELSGRSNDGGRTYVVVYGFQYRADGWDPQAVFTDPFIGNRPPPTALPETCYEYTTANFNNLPI